MLELAAWIRDNGGYVYTGMSPKLVWHGGFQVRGIVADTTLEPGTTLLRLPRKLVMLSESRAKQWKASHLGLDQVPECQFSESASVALKMQITIALELKKGNASFFAPYLNMLPTLDDFRTFHPFLAESDVLSDFGQLPILRVLSKDHWNLVNQKQRCFEAWRRTPKGASFSLQFDDILRATFIYQTRYSSSGIVPFYDLLNTAGEKAQANIAISGGSNDNVITITTLDKVPAGAEMLYSYCENCDNEEMLAQWGVYLEGLSRGLNNFGSINCSRANYKDTGSSSATATLQEAALAELDLNSKTKPSPRCRRHTKPVRCLLARLAWETCAEVWGFAGSPRRLPKIVDKGSKYKYFQAQYNMGAKLLQQEDWKGALKSFQDALRLCSEDENLRNSLRKYIADLQQKIKSH